MLENENNDDSIQTNLNANKLINFFLIKMRYRMGNFTQYTL